MKKIKLFVVGLSFFILVSCSPVTRCSGTVFDNSGAVLTNVKLKIVGKSLAPDNHPEYLTQADGKYNFGEFYVSAELPTDLKLIAEKEGFQTFTKELKFGEDNVDKIVLEKSAN